MQKLIDWIKHNKATAILLSILVYMLFIKPIVLTGMRSNMGYGEFGMETIDYDGGITGSYTDAAKSYAPDEMYPRDIAPTIDIKDRMVITTSNISILVKDVRDSVDDIVEQTQKLGGYFVNKNISTPYEGGTANIQVRIPLTAREEMVNYLRGIGVRVIDENIQASDVTDSYVDLDADLAQLEKTLAKFNEIYDRATTVDDILKVQSNIQSIQRQVDNIKGQMNSLDTMSKTTLLTINLSTDELSLPYSPEQPWRPDVILKLALRDLNLTLRGVGEWVIWLGVYSVIWVPFAIAAFIIHRHLKRKPQA